MPNSFENCLPHSGAFGAIGRHLYAENFLGHFYSLLFVFHFHSQAFDCLVFDMQSSNDQAKVKGLVFNTFYSQNYFTNYQVGGNIQICDSMFFVAEAV